MVPGVAESWDISKDLKTYTFRLRKGAEYHNGRTVDAESVKWNYERILDPKIGFSYTRSSLGEVEKMEVMDKHTLRITLKAPSAVFLANTVYYPCNLIAPDSVDKVDTHPIGCGPSSLSAGSVMPSRRWCGSRTISRPMPTAFAYPTSDGLEGYPKKEDKVRLTALRTGEVDLIENMAYSDVGKFKKESRASSIPGTFPRSAAP